MITGFTGMGLNELVGALARSKHGQQPPARDVQPMPKMDTVQFSVRGREMAASTEATSLASKRQPFVAERPVGTEKPAPANEMSLMDRMKAAFFTSAGDDGFDATVDLNSDGRINHADLALMREQQGPPNPPSDMSLMDRMKAAFFTSAGDDSFDATVDLNSDGRINNADLAVLREQQNALNPAEMLKHMQASFLTRAGDEGFDANMDFNTDGIINFADLAMLRAKLDTPVTRPPPEPITPAAPAAAPEPVQVANTATGNPRFDEPADNSQTVESIRGAFFSSAGDASFNAAADLNGDGRINFADLAELSAR